MPGKRLTAEERGVIENGVAVGMTQQQIAAVLGRSPSTICRELARNHNWWWGPSSPLRYTARPRQLAAYRYCYRADTAHRKATTRARRPKRRRLADPRLWQLVADLLRQDWSPQQIAAMLPRMFPDQPDMRVSHETIYHTLFVQTRGQLRRELTAHLRTGRSKRKSRGGGPTRRHAADPGADPDLGPAGQRRGSRRARTLGRRPAPRRPRAGRRAHPGRTVLPIRAARPNAAPAHRRVGPRPAHPPDRHPARRPAPIIDLRPRQRDGLPRRFSIATGVIVYFWDPQPPATRHQREHQRPAPPVLAQRRRPAPPQPSRLRPHRPQAQHPTPAHPELANSNPSAPDQAQCNSRLRPRYTCRGHVQG